MLRRPMHTSPDGYIRLSLASLAALRFVHLFSHVDDEFRDELQAQTLPVYCAGYSEWQSETQPAISLGWGWFIQSVWGDLLLAPGGVRSNLMLVSAHGYDLGPADTSELLGGWLQELDWQGRVNTALCKQ
jgi:hypothetical protein